MGEMTNLTLPKLLSLCFCSKTAFYSGTRRKGKMCISLSFNL